MARNSSGAYLVAANLVLYAGVALTLWLFSSTSQSRISGALLRQNAYLTTEWRLLQELKSRTDAQLREKDRQIDDLRRRYSALSSSGGSGSEMAEIEAEIQAVETERRSILSSVSEPAAAAEKPAVSAEAALSASTISQRDARVDEIEKIVSVLRDRITSLESELSSNRLYTVMLEKELETSDTKAGGASLFAALRLKRDSVAAQAAEKRPDLRTRSLVRAVVSSPDVRSQYPELLESLDKYFEALSREERLNGQKDAYNAALEAVRAAFPGLGL